MKIKVELYDPIISQAARLVIIHCVDKEFLSAVGNHPQFNHTSMTSLEVSQDILRLDSLDVTIRHFKPLWAWSKAIARADYKNALIEFNQRKIGSLQDRVETIMHECLHLCGYSHDGNYVTAYNLGTVPYAVSAIFIKHLKNIGVLQ